MNGPAEVGPGTSKPPVSTATVVARGGEPVVGPLARAAELELRVREEVLRRERAEARAERAEGLADVARAQIELAEARAAAATDALLAEAREREVLAEAVRTGLSDLADELRALRALAVAADERPVVGALADREPVPPGSRPRSALDPSVRMGELARGARELLAGGRIEAADEVIRGLEDAAARLRAQAPSPDDQR
ncbi:hypothetical protein [Patulibacter sp.]|uniref:hypothetical protein n=1 Tax=Patulibacter sp. TaxID=1912859 RepID=UPI0027282795|nr:hypothetical protein [Patulibacter sp.]MDO9409984.1 hypothetical protein [Patulibacter sp.]